MKIGVAQFLTLIFVLLKVTDKIDWSWWWVFSPLWIPLSVLFVLAMLGMTEED